MAKLNYENIDEMMRKIVYCAGNQSDICRKIGLSTRAATQWKSKGYIPSHLALDIERITNGVVTIRDVLLLEQKVLQARKGRV